MLEEIAQQVPVALGVAIAGVIHHIATKFRTVIVQRSESFSRFIIHTFLIFSVWFLGGLLGATLVGWIIDVVKMKL